MGGSAGAGKNGDESVGGFRGVALGLEVGGKAVLPEGGASVAERRRTPVVGVAGTPVRTARCAAPLGAAEAGPAAPG